MSGCLVVVRKTGFELDQASSKQLVKVLILV